MTDEETHIEDLLNNRIKYGEMRDMDERAISWAWVEVNALRRAMIDLLSDPQSKEHQERCRAVLVEGGIRFVACEMGFLPGRTVNAKIVDNHNPFHGDGE